MTSRIALALALIGLPACVKTAAPHASPQHASAPQVSAPAAPAVPQRSPLTELFARCVGTRCDFDLTVDFASQGAPAELLIDGCNRLREDCGVHVGALTAAGRNTAAELRAALLATPLEAEYDCPGCADGMIYGVYLPATTAAEAGSLHRYDPERLDNLPRALREAHSFLEGVRTAVRTCTPSEHVELHGSCRAN